MKIVKLTAENYKRLQAVEITPDGDTVIVSGKNAAGKSSVLDAIWHALGGAAGGKTVPKPIRDGADRAEVELDLGDLLVTKVWSESGVRLTVQNRDGSKVASPQAVLDKLTGRLMFDPMAFIGADAKRQRDMLLDVVKLPFDPDALARERKELFDERTVVGRQVRDMEGELAALAAPPDDLPVDEVDLSALLEELSAARDKHAANERVCDAYDAARERSLRLAGEVERLRQELDQAIAASEAARDDERAAFEACARLEEPPPIADFEKRLAEADEVNRAIRAVSRYRDVEASIARLRSRQLDLSEAIANIDKAKAAGLADVEFPVAGLGFDDDGVTLNGVPFSQAATSEQLRAAMAIAVAGNPTIRVARLTDGSLLDSDSLALVAELAAEHDVQVWIERVSDGEDGVGIVIEDGTVRA